MDVAGCFSWNAADNMIVLERQGKPAWFFADRGECSSKKGWRQPTELAFPEDFVNK